MTTIIEDKDIYNHIKKTFELLKEQEYTLVGEALTREERKKLFEYFFTYDEDGMKEDNFEELEDLDEDLEGLTILNKEAFNRADEKIKNIIIKCGADPNNIFYLNKGFEIDDNIYNSMYKLGVLQIGDYVIKSSFDHPVSRDSEEINSFREDCQEDLYLRAIDGEITFNVFENKNGKLTPIYYHRDGIHFGGHVFFKNNQIGGNYGLREFEYDFGEKKSREMNEIINELIPFFYQFEELLSNNLKKEKPIEYKKENV